MKLKLLIIFSLLSFISNAQISAKEDEYLKGLFNSRNFSKFITEANRIRQQPFGKCEKVDFYIGKAYCASGRSDVAMEFYNNIKNYKPEKSHLKIIDDAKRSCSAEANGGTSAQALALAAAFNAKSPVNKVTGSVDNYEIALGKIEDGPPENLVQLRNITDDEMESRLFDLDQGEEAKSYYSSMLGSNYNITIEAGFIFITLAEHNDDADAINAEIKNLERIYDFYISHFAITPPDMFLTVYLLPKEKVGDDENLTRLMETADKVHGLKVPGNYEGYEYFDDLSILGMGDMEDFNYKGVLAHELWHLVVRSEIGDVPPWLDEGIACVYQASEFEGNQLVGKGGRFHELDYPLQTDKVPHLGEFLNYSWSKFMGYDDGSKKLAGYNYAYAEYLMLYLQSQNKLQEVFDAVSNQTVISDIDNATIKSDTRIFEELFGTDIATIDKQFDAWMVATNGFSIY